MMLGSFWSKNMFWTIDRSHRRLAMQISVSDAKAHLTELLRRAEEGEDIVLTRHGQPVARLAPIVAERNRRARLANLKMMRQAARTKAPIGPGAFSSSDYLFSAGNLPE
jgi:prevent-host-death family protein